MLTVWTSAYAQGQTKTYTIDKLNGNLYHANGSANQNWNCSWKSTEQPELTFGCGTINNMNWADNNVQLMSGTATQATYAITAPAGCVIEEYSFTFVNNAHDTGIALTMEDTGKAYTTSQEEQTVSATGLAVETVSFLFKGPNGKGVILKDFTVKIKIVSTDVKVSKTLVEQGKVTTAIGNKNQGIIRSTITVTGSGGTCNLQSIDGRFMGKDTLDITKVKVFFAKNDRELYVDEENLMPWREQNGELCADTVLNGKYEFTVDLNKELAPGVHYMWIAYDIAETAKEGNYVDARIYNYVVDGDTIKEESGSPKHNATIFLSESAVLLPYDMGTKYYRIPSITVTKDGKRLVTITDDRANFNSDLPSHCKLMAQYSDDFGKSWSKPQLVAGSEELGGNYGHGDASIVTNRDNGDIIGIMTSSPHGYGFFNGGARQRPAWKTIVSHDNGLTWEAPVDHTDDLYGEYCDDPTRRTWCSGFSGSGAALQKRDGTLVSSFVNRLSDNSKHFYFFMSKDGGQNWYVSGTSGTSDADEPKTLERNNGDLAISVRHGGYNYHNVTSNDGETWHYKAQTPFNTGIYGNACDGEYMVWCSTIEGNPWNIALQTGPNSGSRENVSIALSTDEGETFGKPKTICPRGSAYSATTVLPDGTLGIYYEENGLGSDGYTMRYVRCSLDWASSGAYKFTEDSPFYPIKSTVDTGINDVLGNDSDKASSDNTIYDLQGRRVLNPIKGGVYIQNGKLLSM